MAVQIESGKHKSQDPKPATQNHETQDVKSKTLDSGPLCSRRAHIFYLTSL